ncbi:energy transducer TonB [Prevotella cerevisiae]|uniref:Energy transducer TonB n=1 Tax=Segatella cerevisiae TaxID=2053716 RepID=A0ABT1BZM6_9BACT|nr:energy transducer TonB [Segatella cerevisiae]MCO6026434.1 energy transducer TonB [Segatella cerevisiae]
MSRIDLNDPKWLNLVFSGRNKKYGAYELREGTPRRNLTALLIILGTAAAIIICVGVILFIDNHSMNLNDIKSVEFNDMKALPPLAQGNQLSRRQSGYASHKVVKQGEKVLKLFGEDQQRPVIPPDAATTDNNGSPGGTSDVGESTGGSDSSVAASGKEGDKAHNDELQALTQTTPDNQALNFRIVEQLPEFPGGWVELMKWLDKNIQYPPTAMKSKIEGEVIVSFIINTNGALSNIKITKSAHPLLNAEAMRVVHKMPKWKPGIHNDKPCKTMFSIPIVFRL